MDHLRNSPYRLTDIHMKQGDDTRARLRPGVTIAISLLRCLQLTLGNEMF